MSTTNGATRAGKLFFQDCYIKYLRSTHMALDGMVTPLDAAHEDEVVNQLFEYCMNKLDDAQRLALCEKLHGHLEATPAYDRPHAANSQGRDKTKLQAQDSAHFSGKPRSQAAPQSKPVTTATAEFISRVKIDNVGIQAQPNTPQPSASAVSDFHRRFPQAAKIKIGL